MKTLWNDTNYGNDLRLTNADAQMCNHSGDCSNEVEFVKTKPYVKKQLAALLPEKLKMQLAEYGAWDDAELSNHDENLTRWIWISAGDIVERKFAL